MADRLSDANPSEEPRRATERRGPSLARLLRARAAGVIASVVLVVGAPAGAQYPVPQPIPIALADFDYTDSSGEPQDQSAKHAALLGTFVESLRRDLANSRKYLVVTLDCGEGPCSAGRTDPAKLLGRARAAGAALLVYGGIHKVSTLVQWAKLQVVDVRSDRLVLDRLLTFRGDDDRAWQHAEAFLAADLEQRGLSDGAQASEASNRKNQP